MPTRLKVICYRQRICDIFWYGDTLRCAWTEFLLSSCKCQASILGIGIQCRTESNRFSFVVHCEIKIFYQVMTFFSPVYRYISSNVLPNFMQSLSNHGLSSLPEPSGLPSIWRRLHDWKYVLLHFLTSVRLIKQSECPQICYNMILILSLIFS